MKDKVCPKCGAELRWVRRGSREAGCCECNPRGPVVERDIDAGPDREPMPAGTEFIGLPDIDVEIAGALVGAGYTTIDEVREASDEELLAISGIGSVRLSKIRAAIAMVEE